MSQGPSARVPNLGPMLACQGSGRHEQCCCRLAHGPPPLDEFPLPDSMERVDRRKPFRGRWTMPSALGVAGEVAGAAAALSGLLLVFVGAVSATFDSFQKQEQNTVRSRYQTRAWFAFIGFVLSLLSMLLA